MVFLPSCVLLFVSDFAESSAMSHSRMIQSPGTFVLARSPLGSSARRIPPRHVGNHPMLSGGNINRC